MNTNNMIFVFGSNTAGIHGAGAAKYAKEKRGAVYGIGYGLIGQSFAIPTKDRYIRHTLPLNQIEVMVKGFLVFASHRPDLQFQVTRIGCGLAGMRDQDVAPLFYGAPSNCYFDEKWEGWIPGDARYYYWGTF